MGFQHGNLTGRVRAHLPLQRRDTFRRRPPGTQRTRRSARLTGRHGIPTPRLLAPSEHPPRLIPLVEAWRVLVPCREPAPGRNQFASRVPDQPPAGCHTIGHDNPTTLLQPHRGKHLQIPTADRSSAGMVVGETEDGHVAPEILVIHTAIRWKTGPLLIHKPPDGPRDTPVVRRLVERDAVFDGIPTGSLQKRIARTRSARQRHQCFECGENQVVRNDGCIREDDGHVRVLPGTWGDRQIGIVIQNGQLCSQVVEPGTRTGQCGDEHQGNRSPHWEPPRRFPHSKLLWVSSVREHHCPDREIGLLRGPLNGITSLGLAADRHPKLHRIRVGPAHRPDMMRTSLLLSRSKHRPAQTRRAVSATSAMRSTPAYGSFSSSSPNTSGSNSS
ncbi:hypothetical protein COSO111634_18165 [Corallococcus soli]